MPKRLVVTAVALCLCCVAGSVPARAQDWTVRRNPFDAGTLRRYKAILARSPHDTGALASLTRLYRKYRSVDKLVGEYEAELAKSPGSHSALVVLARLERDRGNTDRAVALFNQALTAEPGDTTSSLAVADLYYRGGHLAEARGVYERALAAKAPERVEKTLVHKLAALQEEMGDIDAAEKSFQRYFRLAPRDVQAVLELGDLLLKHERYQKAIAVFSAAEGRLKSDPAQRIEVVARLGSAREGAGDLDAAVAEYRRAMSMARRGYYIRKELTERIIDIYRRRQDLATLTSYYEAHWPAARRDHFEWDTLGRLYEEVGMQDKAVDAYRKAVRKAPDELDTHRRLIRLLETTGREDEALAQYERVIQVAPGEPRFQLELAERYYRRGQRKKALALLRRVEARFGGDAGVQAALTDLYSRWGEEKLALESQIRLVRIEPGEVIHLVNLGEQYFQLGDKKKAIATWKRIIAHKSAENYARLGRVYGEHDMSTQALAMYAKALKMAPEDPDVYRGRATVFERRKDWHSAIADWMKVYELQPDQPSSKAARVEARRRVVGLLKRAGQRSLRSRMLAWSRAFHTGDREAGYFLVEASLRSGDAKTARVTLEQLLKRDSNDTDAMLSLVKVYEMEQHYDQAIALLLDLVERIPSRERDFYNRIAELKTRMNQDDEAILYAQKALEKSPKDPVAYEQLADRYLEMQQYDQAMAALKKTVELAPRNFKAYFALARLYRNTNRLDEATTVYRHILERSTDDEILHKAGRQAINLEELTGTLGDLEKVVSPLAFTFGHKEVYRRIVVELYDRYVPALVARTRSDDAAVRKAALAELERLGKHGLKPLLEALADERDPAQRRIAVSVLGYLGNRSAAAPLVHLAEHENKNPTSGDAPSLITEQVDWDLRIEALVAAGRLGDPETIPDLLGLAHHTEVSMREAAIFALGMTRDRRALAPLTTALGDERESVQTLACLGLAYVGDRHATKAIAGVISDTTRPDPVRAACAYAAGVIADPAATRALVDILGQSNDEAPRLAAWALGRLGASSAVPALLTGYFGRRTSIRDTIAWALPRAAAGKPAAGEPPAFLDYPVRSGKFNAPKAILQLPGPLQADPVPASLLENHRAAIVTALKSTLSSHLDLVHRVLTELDAGTDGLALGALTAGTSPHDVRLTRTLQEIGSSLTPTLAELAEHRDPVIRRLALSVLAKLGSDEVTATLAKALDASTLEHRVAAMEAIAPFMRRGGPATRRLRARVTESLAAADWREQVAAATAMGHYGSGADRGALIGVVGDRHHKAFVRQAAVAALGELGAAEAIPVLTRAARDPARAVQENAVLSLEAIGGPVAQAALRAIAADPSVTASARALASGAKKN